MPYDNDLGQYADSILQQLESIDNPILTTAIQVDRPGPGGMERYWMGEKTSVTFTEIEKSNSKDSFQSFMDWVYSNGTTKRIAIVFLNHGGRLDEVGLDEYPNSSSGFLSIHDIKGVLESFNSKKGKPIDLLYFQVCAKGSIEPLFELRSAALYSMASQNLLGAPNYYYPALDQLTQNSSPVDLANLIVDGERSDMYYSETLLDNSKWDALINHMRNIPTEENSLNNLQLIKYWNSTYYDLRSFLIASGYSDKQLLEWDTLFSELLVFHKVNKENPIMDNYCGISLLSPWDTDFERVYSNFEFYKEFNMSEIAKKMRE